MKTHRCRRRRAVCFEFPCEEGTGVELAIGLQDADGTEVRPVWVQGLQKEMGKEYPRGW